MNETDLLARIGRLAIEREKQNAEYTNLLVTLAKVVTGEIDRGRVLVNLTAGSWMVSEPGTGPATPATFNGLPEIAVAPAAPEPYPPVVEASA